MEMLWCARCRLWMEKVHGGCRWCGWRRNAAARERSSPSFLFALLRRLPSIPERTETG